MGAKLGKSRSGIATFERPTANPRWSSITDALTASESTPLVLVLVAIGWELRLAEQLASLLEQLPPETVLSRLQVVPRSRDERELEGVADLLRQAANPRWSSITDALTASESTPLVLVLVAMGWELRLAEQLASLVEQLPPETVLSQLQVVPRSRNAHELEGVVDLLRQAADRLASW